MVMHLSTCGCARCRRAQRHSRPSAYELGTQAERNLSSTTELAMALHGNYMLQCRELGGEREPWESCTCLEAGGCHECPRFAACYAAHGFEVLGQPKTYDVHPSSGSAESLSSAWMQCGSDEDEDERLGSASDAQVEAKFAEIKVAVHEAVDQFMDRFVRPRRRSLCAQEADRQTPTKFTKAAES